MGSSERLREFLVSVVVPPAECVGHLWMIEKVLELCPSTIELSKFVSICRCLTALVGYGIMLVMAYDRTDRTCS